MREDAKVSAGEGPDMTRNGGNMLGRLAPIGKGHFSRRNPHHREEEAAEEVAESDVLVTELAAGSAAAAAAAAQVVGVKVARRRVLWVEAML